ncbi:hypothetical protein [Parendozoicomonas callyspongiae]|uniref:hypothetical protein n=1 Tax=Parendozoicomonas callyspongiae TaxID=2942213 RepID=UPI0024BDAA3F|nr:hypothetical protein [Sansalvadorimonas sp. 2012CJ34-2]
MCDAASQIILVTDSSKFDRKSYHLIRPFAKFETFESGIKWTQPDHLVRNNNKKR